MKKLRMIVTSIIVLAIVGSAFAFKIKESTFCILDIGAGGTNCTTYLQNRMKTVVVFFGTKYKYAPFWDHNVASCTAPNNGLCTDSARLTLD
jgi:hypothetical protein